MDDPSPDRRDAQALSRFGYVQELRRALGGFASFAISFSIISVLTGVTTTYGTALSSGGPAGLGLGWPIVCVGTILTHERLADGKYNFLLQGTARARVVKEVGNLIAS